MFFNDRDQMRRFYCDVYTKLEQNSPLDPLGQQVADVIQSHPEYHALLKAPDAINKEFTPEAGESNPFLHMSMHLAIREQVSTNRPAGIAAIFQKLAGKLGVEEAEHRMIECLGQAMWEAQRNNSLPDEAHYLACLQRL